MTTTDRRTEPAQDWIDRAAAAEVEALFGNVSTLRDALIETLGAEFVNTLDQPNSAAALIEGFAIVIAENMSDPYWELSDVVKQDKYAVSLIHLLSKPFGTIVDLAKIEDFMDFFRGLQENFYASKDVEGKLSLL